MPETAPAGCQAAWVVPRYLEKNLEAFQREGVSRKSGVNSWQKVCVSLCWEMEWEMWGVWRVEVTHCEKAQAKSMPSSSALVGQLEALSRA